MATMHFARGPEDVGEPTGLVIRTQASGQLRATLIKGDDPSVVLIAQLLVMMIAEVGMENFLPMARAAGEEAGFDIDEMIEQIQQMDQETADG